MTLYQKRLFKSDNWKSGLNIRLTCFEYGEGNYIVDGEMSKEKKC